MRTQISLPVWSIPSGFDVGRPGTRCGSFRYSSPGAVPSIIFYPVEEEAYLHRVRDTPPAFLFIRLSRAHASLQAYQWLGRPKECPTAKLPVEQHSA